MTRDDRFARLARISQLARFGLHPDDLPSEASGLTTINGKAYEVGSKEACAAIERQKETP